MKFKVDENLPSDVAVLLRTAGHEADTVGEEGLAGTEDCILAERVRQERRALVTLDIGFADLRNFPPGDYAGLIVIRSKRQDKPTLVGLARRLIPVLASEVLDGRLWIVETDRVRIRGGQSVG